MATPDSARSSLEFTEEMKGFAEFGEKDFRRGLEAGKTSASDLMFHLTIRIDDVDEFVSNPKHQGRADGYVQSSKLGGRCTVENGVFNLFVDAEDSSRKLMLYRLFFVNDKGEPFTLKGYKDVKDDPGFDPLEIWKDTTTLYTRILRGHVNEANEETAETVAAGMIFIQKLDFIKQLTTFKTAGPTPAHRAAAVAKFGKLFLGSLWDVYGVHLPS